MTEEDRIKGILNILKKIDESEESVRNYFNQNQVPFSRAQYYTYRRTLQKNGDEGLHDKRKDGNYIKLTERIKDYIVSIVGKAQWIGYPKWLSA